MSYVNPTMAAQLLRAAGWTQLRLTGDHTNGGMSDIYYLTDSTKVVKITSVYNLNRVRGGDSIRRSQEMACCEATVMSKLRSSSYVIPLLNCSFLDSNLRRSNDAYQIMYVLLLEERGIPLSERPPRSERELRKVLHDGLEGLRALHKNSPYNHRDCRLENLLYLPRADNFVLADFGALGVRDTSSKGRHTRFYVDHTDYPTYPPEQGGEGRGCLYENSDLYILSASILNFAKKESVPLSTPFAQILEGMVQQEPEKRSFRSAEQALKALSKIDDSVPPTPRKWWERWFPRATAQPAKQAETIPVHRELDPSTVIAEAKRFLLAEQYNAGANILSSLFSSNADAAVAYVYALLLDGRAVPMEIFTTYHNDYRIQLLWAILQNRRFNDGIHNLQHLSRGTEGQLKGLYYFYLGEILTKQDVHEANRYLRQASGLGIRSADALLRDVSAMNTETFRRQRRQETIEILLP